MFSTRTSRAKTNRPTLRDKTFAFSSLGGLEANLIDSLNRRFGLQQIVAQDRTLVNRSDFVGVYGHMSTSPKNQTRLQLFHEAFTERLTYANPDERLELLKESERIDLAVFTFNFEFFPGDLRTLTLAKIPHLIILARHSALFLTSVIMPGVSACGVCLSKQTEILNDQSTLSLHYPTQSLMAPAGFFSALTLLEDLILQSVVAGRSSGVNPPHRRREPISLYRIKPNGEVEIFEVPPADDCRCFIIGEYDSA